MRDGLTWLAALSSASRIDRTLLRVLAATLANPETPADLLLNIADALVVDAADAKIAGRLRDAGQLTWLAAVVTVEAEHRPGFW